jgi:hypothetical protein
MRAHAEGWPGLPRPLLCVAIPPILAQWREPKRLTVMAQWNSRSGSFLLAEEHQEGCVVCALRHGSLEEQEAEARAASSPRALTIYAALFKACHYEMSRRIGRLLLR